MDIKRELVELENFLNYMSSVLCRSDRTITEYRYDMQLQSAAIAHPLSAL